MSRNENFERRAALLLQPRHTHRITHQGAIRTRPLKLPKKQVVPTDAEAVNILLSLKLAHLVTLSNVALKQRQQKKQQRLGKRTGVGREYRSTVFSPDACNAMFTWLYDNRHHPTPTTHQLQMFHEEFIDSGLNVTLAQIRTFFANARRPDRRHLWYNGF